MKPDAIAPVSRAADKTGGLGALVSAMGCGACFPALASLGSAIGLGFLQQYEGLFISTLMPLFTLLALLANALGWLHHRQWWRTLLGVAGPLAVLTSLYVWMGYTWSVYLVYVGLALMAGVALWDLLSPAHRHCGPQGCDLPAPRGSV